MRTLFVPVVVVAVAALFAVVGCGGPADTGTTPPDYTKWTPEPLKAEQTKLQTVVDAAQTKVTAAEKTLADAAADKKEAAKTALGLATTELAKAKSALKLCTDAMAKPATTTTTTTTTTTDKKE